MKGKKEQPISFLFRPLALTLWICQHQLAWTQKRIMEWKERWNDGMTYEWRKNVLPFIPFFFFFFLFFFIFFGPEKKRKDEEDMILVISVVINQDQSGRNWHSSSFLLPVFLSLPFFFAFSSPIPFKLFPFLSYLFIYIFSFSPHFLLSSFPSSSF